MADSASVKKTAVTNTPKMRQQRSDEKRLKRVLFIVMLLACCAGSAYFYINTLQLIEESQNAMQELASQPALPDPNMANESKEIDAAETGLSDMTKVTSMAMQTALLAEISGKYPVSPENKLQPVDTSGVAVEIVEIDPDPPAVTVVAILIKEDDKIAMLDVVGEEGGLIVRQGSNFASGTARVTKIDAKGVTFTWMKKSYHVPF
ncbi:MAG: hypothetical protein LBQ58_00070 [Synergistaceae bacterium]|jgi:hypothetical protein|nr:hypothetical protein [Synergistaceae bacterium]